MNSDYKVFLQGYVDGLDRIAKLKMEEAPPNRADGESLLSILQSAVAALKRTTFGSELFRDATLEHELNEFEARLAYLADQLHSREPVDPPRDMGWVRAAASRLERRFVFYGEMGKILHYFRDRGSYLSLDDFQDKRSRILNAGKDISRAIDTLLDHIISEVLFTRSERQQLVLLAESLKRVADLPLKPVERLETLMIERREVIQQQFAASVSQLALRLFGHIRRQTLDEFLTLKSATALQFDYKQWRDSILPEADWSPAVEERIEATIQRQLNRYVEAAYKRALGKSEKEGWQTAEIIRFTRDKETRKLLHARI